MTRYKNRSEKINMSQESTTESREANQKKPVNPKVIIAASVVVVIAAFLGIRSYLFSLNHVSTDDAQISSDIVQISPQLTANVVKIAVDDAQEVKKNDLLVELDDASFKEAVAQAEANLQLALAQEKASLQTVDLTNATGSAQITQAQGVVEQTTSGISSAETDVQRLQASVGISNNAVISAVAQEQSATAGLSIAISTKQRLGEAVRSASAAVTSAKASVQSASANLSAAQATFDRAHREARRLTSLAKEGAISGQQADNAESAELIAKSQLDAAKEAVVSAKAALQGRNADLKSAETQFSAADSSIQQAKSALATSKSQTVSAKHAVTVAQAQLRSAQQSVQSAKARSTQAAGQLAQAETTNQQVEVSKSTAKQASARVAQAKAALADALLNLSRTKIYAPCDGTVNKKSILVGNLVQPGTPLMVIIPKQNAWVVANLKETQMEHVKAGLSADIEVDAFPGKSFKGKVDSISLGTGSVYALLPPDNATGNFTKVVQRVPVKIIFDDGQPGLDRLRLGMSVQATIETKQ